MTVRGSVRPNADSAENAGFRLLRGRRIRKPTVAPWMIVTLIAVVAFLGLGFARTSLDGSAFELAELDKAIAVQTAINRQLSLEIARLENPARISPLAEELGLVIPVEINQILVDLDTAPPVLAETSGDGTNQ